jgi:hypothetical protein
MGTDGTFAIFQTAIRKTEKVPSVPEFPHYPALTDLLAVGFVD